MAGAWMLVAAAAVALALTCATTTGVEARSLDIGVTEFEFWHKFDLAGYKSVFGTVGAFGEGQAIDYAVLDSDDKEIGRAQGIGISDSLQGYGIQELFTDTFTAGEYNGSSITFGGHWNQTWTDNELPVLGGTGEFKFAAGTAVFSEEVRGSDVYFHVTGEVISIKKLVSSYRK